MLEFISLYDKYTNECEALISEFFSSDELKNFILSELNRANKNDTDKARGSENNFLKYLIDKTNDNITDFIKEECIKILNSILDKFKGDVDEFF